MNYFYGPFSSSLCNKLPEGKAHNFPQFVKAKLVNITPITWFMVDISIFNGAYKHISLGQHLP